MSRNVLLRCGLMAAICFMGRRRDLSMTALAAPSPSGPLHFVVGNHTSVTNIDTAEMHTCSSNDEAYAMNPPACEFVGAD